MSRSSVIQKKKNRKESRDNRKTKAKLYQRNMTIFAICLLLVFMMIFGIMAGLKIAGEREERERETAAQQNTQQSGPEQWMQEGAPYIDVQLLTPNSFSRPQIAIQSISGIAVHYTANPGATAQENRDYFENLAVTQEAKVSSHFVIGLDGEVIQCIPTAEISYATNQRNVDTISIECCHPDEGGAFNSATYESLVKLTAWLCTRFGLTEENVIRHYDASGKNCPKYYVENTEAWVQMKADIVAQIQEDYVLQENLYNEG